MTAEFLTPAEVRDRYRGRISLRTLANWRSTGQGPSFCKVGGRVLYPVAALTEWEGKRTANDNRRGPHDNDNNQRT